MSNYPIVEQRPLGIVARRGLRKRIREAGDLPALHPHQVLVYRVDGELVVDNGLRRVGHEQVINATHVSVVDVSTNVAITTQLAIPAADGGTFLIHVTFACTVTDPALVVRNGKRNIGSLVSNYIRSDSWILKLGQGYTADKIAEVRSEVDSRIRSREIEDPLIEPGMRIRLAVVEVPTPAGLAKFERERTEQQRESELKREKVGLDHSVDIAAQDSGHTLAERQLDHEQKLAARRADFNMGEMEKLAAATQDSRKALLLAVQRGELSLIDYADVLRADQLRALREHLGVVKTVLDSDVGDYINIDPDKIDKLVNGAFDDAIDAAAAVRPQPGLGPVQPLDAAAAQQAQSEQERQNDRGGRDE